MDKGHFVERILNPVTAFLNEALAGNLSGRSLAGTAGPLIRAIETVPGAGRVAVFLMEGDMRQPELVSGPSFSQPELDALQEILRTHRLDERPVEGLEMRLPEAPRNSDVLKLFPLWVPGEKPAAILLSARDATDAPDGDLFDTFIDQITQLAGLIIEDRRLRHRLTSQQSVFEALMRAAPDAIIRIDRHGYILDFAGRSEDLFGHGAADMVGQHVSRLMPEPHAGRHDAYVDAFLQTGERRLPDFGRRLEAVHRDGSVFPVEIALSELVGDDTVEFVGIVRDISRRVMRERELESMREALEHASRQSALGELASMIAHELNQPLTAITNYMDAMELRLAGLDSADADTLRELARKAAGQARLGAEVIRRTRRMALKGETEARADDFHAAVREAIELISKTPSAAGVNLTFERTGHQEPVVFDRVQIQQVVLNLASNALRALAGDDQPALHIASHVGEDHAQIVVEDSGPGIPDGEKEKIFEQFYRKREGGMGLGLAVVSRIASAHEGEISVSDRPEGGAVFVFRIPRRTRI